MKLERINDNQIRCTLTGQDLAERHLQLSELAYGNDKTKRLFREMMQQASCELGFDTDDIPLLIEAIPLPGNSIILTVTKVEYPEELDTRFSNFSDYGEYPGDPEDDEDDSPTLEGADTIMDLFHKISAAAAALRDADSGASTPDAEEAFAVPADAADTSAPAESDQTPAPADTDIVKLFSFREMDHLVRLAHVLDNFYTADNSLFLDVPEHVYYLVLHKGSHTPSEFNKVCNILSEYALQNRYVDSAEAYFEEHFKCIAAQDALQRLAKV